MLLGQYQVQVDEKGRVAVPKRFRQELGEKLVVTQGYENCLIVVDWERWAGLIKEVQAQPLSSLAGRETRRFLLGGAFELRLDAQGRFVTPPVLREYARIHKEAICLGIGRYLELWDAGRWREYQEYLDEHIEKVAERLTQA